MAYFFQTQCTKALRERKLAPTPKFQPKVMRDLNTGFRIMVIQIRMSVGLSQNVADALSCRRQSFRRVWDKAAVDCMRNAKKYPKIPYSAMVKKHEK